MNVGHAAAWVAVAVAAGLDAGTTAAAPGLEANPLAVVAIGAVGLPAAVVALKSVSVAVAAAWALALPGRWRPLPPALVAGVWTGAAVVNLGVLA
jgi:hypothetical protein